MKFAHMAAAVLIVTLFASSPLFAETVTNWNLQAVNSDGTSAWSESGSFTITGVILNTPEDMLDSTYDSDAVANNTMGAEWQMFIQGINDDHAGTAMWMGQNYYSRVPFGDPNTRRYTESQWLAEMFRLNYDSSTGHQFHVGDLVEITVSTSLFFGGKRNVNEAHSISNDFTITLIQADYGLPTAEEITIRDLFASTSAAGYDASYPMFDQTRTTGAEYYQGTYVLLTGLTLTDSSGWGEDEWGDRLCVAVDEYGNEFTLRMPLSDLGDIPTGEFSAYGIINQESGSGSDGRYGYELFVTEIVTVPEPVTLSVLAIGALACLRRRRK